MKNILKVISPPSLSFLYLDGWKFGCKGYDHLYLTLFTYLIDLPLPVPVERDTVFQEEETKSIQPTLLDPFYPFVGTVLIK